MSVWLLNDHGRWILSPRFQVPALHKKVGIDTESHHPTVLVSILDDGHPISYDSEGKTLIFGLLGAHQLDDAVTSVLVVEGSVLGIALIVTDGERSEYATKAVILVMFFRHDLFINEVLHLFTPQRVA
jgi:hypothetical protein